MHPVTYDAGPPNTGQLVRLTEVDPWLDAHEASPEFPFVGIGRSQHGRLSLDGRSIARREAGRRQGNR